MKNALFGSRVSAGALVLAALVTACDYTVPLVTQPDQDIDRALVGLWGRTNEDDRVEQLLVLPLGSREYLVGFPAGSPNALFARGCRWEGDGLSLIQLDWFGTAKGGTPDDAKTFQYASYAITSDVLRVRLLNTGLIPGPYTNGAELAAALSAHRDNPELFRAPMVFFRSPD